MIYVFVPRFSYRWIVQKRLIRVGRASHPMLPHPRAPPPSETRQSQSGGDREGCSAAKTVAAGAAGDCASWALGLGADAHPPHALLCILMPATLSGQKPDSLVDFGSPHWLRMSFHPESGVPPDEAIRILDPFRIWRSRMLVSSPWGGTSARVLGSQTWPNVDERKRQGEKRRPPAHVLLDDILPHERAQRRLKKLPKAAVPPRS